MPLLQKTKSGFAALYLILIVASATFVAVVTMGDVAVQSQNEALTANRLQNQAATDLCIELALQVVRDTPDGDSVTASDTVGEISCAYDLDGNVPNRSMDVTVTRDAYTKLVNIDITELHPEVVATWEE